MRRFITLLLLLCCSYGLFAQITVTLGTGTVNNTNQAYPAPYGGYYYGARHQMLIPASEILAAGGYAGNITALQFDVFTAQGSPLTGFEIKLGTTTATALGTWQTMPTTSVFYTSSYTDVAGWNLHPFTTAFFWDGVSSLIIETCFSNSAYTYNAIMNQSATTYASTMWFNQDAGFSCSMTGTNVISQRPNMKLTFGPSMLLNAGISAINSPPIPSAPGLKPVTATLKNFGSTALTSATIGWSVDGVSQSPYAWTGSLTQGQATAAPIALGSYNFPSGVHTLKVWSSAPNSGVDEYPNNDTATLTMNYASSLSGTYTIGGTGADYPTITAARADLALLGITGPVIFNINTGTYTEQMEFPEIIGASATNTITFKSTTGNPADVTWQFTGTSANNYTFKMNAGDYYRFKFMTIKNLDATYGRVIDLTAGANYNIFEGNRIISGGASSSTTGCIYDGSTLNNYNTYLNNYMQGGYYTMYLYGVSSTSWEKGTVVKGNEIVGSYYYPLYMYYCDSIEVIGNYLHDGVSPYSYGIMVYYVNNYYRIVGNRVIIVGSTSTACYGIRDYYGNYVSYNANPTGYGLVANNMISIGGGTTTNYGLYSYYGNGTETSYNTVYMYGNTVTTTRALYQANTSTNTLGQKYFNNIFVNTGGGYAAYYSTVAQVSACDYNDYYGTNSAYFVYWGANRADIPALQAASSKDMASISVLPSFVSNTDLHNNSLATYQVGTPLTSVVDDIDGNPRHPATPCLGADEYILYSNDAGVMQLTSPLAACPGVSTVKVKVKNFGIASFTGVTVNWSINNVTQTPYTYTSAIAAGANVELTLGTYNFLSGTSYTLKFYTSNPNSTADQNPVNDTLTKTNFKTAISGTFTIGPSPANFQTIAAAVAELNANGVCGPVTFNVQTGSGPYTGGFELSDVLGSTATNTITFNGNANEINQGTVSYIVGINNVSYLTFTNFRIINTTPAADFIGIIVRGGSHHVTLTNNYVHMGITGTGSASAGIAVAGGTSAPSAVGSNGRYMNISNNEIIGAYYGLTLVGNASYLDCYGNTVNNNNIHDFYVYGLYLSNVDTTTVSGNNINRANRTVLSTFYGSYLATCRNVKFLKNKIHSGGSASYSAYGIYVTTSVNSLGYETELINNAVYNLQTTSTFYGLYFSGTRNYLKIYHNTVSCILPTGNTGSVYGIYYSGAPDNHDVKNNIVTMEGSGTGTKYLVYVATTSTTYQSDFNNFYFNMTGGTNYFGYWGAANNTFADWQTASTKDMATSSANPVLGNPLAGNITPLSGNIDNMGTPLGVLTDLNNITRSLTTPDPGALEFTGIAADIAIISGGYLAPGQCLSTNDSVYMKFTNTIGGTINFATTPVTVYWSATGPVNSSGSIVVNTGTLAAAASITVGGVGVNMSKPGTYVLSGYVGANTINLYQGNDTLNNISSKIIYNPFYVQPGTTYVGNTTTTVPITAKSTFFPGGAFYISEMCHNKVATGAPTVGWAALTWLMAGDYIEITGVPNSDLGGYTLQQWSTALDGTYTFPSGTILGPTGTAIIAVGQMGSSVASPANFYYHGQGANTTDYQSAATMGRVLLNSSNTIIDAVGYGAYTFPAAANVPTSEWSSPTTASGSATSGFRLTAPDNNTGSSWSLVNATIIQDPGVVNAGTIVPSPGSLTGFTWSQNGVVFATNVVDTIVGPWTTPGSYNYIASYVTPCGTLTDTVKVKVLLANVTGTTQICAGDSAMISVALTGTPPFTFIGNDGSGNDTFTVATSPWVAYVKPALTTTYTVVKFADAGNVFVNSGASITVNVTPAPTVTLGTFAPLCASAAPLALTGGLPAGGTYTGTGVTGSTFYPSVAGPGTHTITYTYQDPTTLCYGNATQPITVGAGPAISVTPNLDICPGTPTTLSVTTPGSATSVFFSEYIEGTSNNKAIEIFNGTPDTVSLANYRIGWATNGGGWNSWHTFPAGAKLAPHKTWVMVANQVSLTLYDTTLANEVLAYPSVVHHNGDDARSVEMTTDGGATWTIIDIIGTPDVDPGTGWPVAGVNNATVDHTLIRKPDISHGDTSWTNVAGTTTANSQYDVQAVNTFTNLGFHTYNAPPVLNLAYFWSNGATTPSITVSPSVATTYTVTVIDVATNCSSVGTVAVGMKPAATVNLGADFNVCSDKTAVIDAGTGFTSYIWSTGATTQTIVVDGAVIGQGNTVTYTVTVTNSAGCEGIDAVAVTSIDCSGIDDPNAANKLTFWPNPSDGHFFLKIRGISGDATLTIANAAGQVIEKEIITLNGELTREFQLENIAPGIYMVRLQTTKDVITKQIIIK
jgi:hypothetical protein